MNKIIIKYIYDKIIELSDLDLQRKLWLNENNDTGLISSYDELMCSLFDDSKCDSEFTEIDFILDEEERNKYYQYSFCEIESTSSVSGKTDCYKIDENWMFCTQY
jgi:hypothetical protein